jgi:4-amino-4-deoxy-L-arabinose transferase-like glycosyltransferase
VFWIVTAATVISFTNLGGAALWDEDETLYASCAREMLQRDDWVVPYFNGQMFPDKPPLMFWTMMVGFKLFGINELGARFFSAIFAVATALATYKLGRRLFNADVGFWAGLIVPSSLIFTVSARAATVDSALTLATTLAMLAFATAGIAKPHKPEKLAEPKSLVRPWFAPDSWLFLVLFWACLGLAVLAKGPIGLLLPAASVGLFLMIMNLLARSEDTAEWLTRAGEDLRRPPTNAHGSSAANGGKEAGRFGRTRWLLTTLARLWGPANFFKSLWQMRPLTGMLVAAAVAGPWFVLAAIRDPEMLTTFLAKFNWRPFTQPILGHSGPFWYYLPAVLIGFYPWSAFLGQSLTSLVRRLRTRDSWTAAHILLACWIGVPLVFWSICSTKLPHYLLPVYPALSLVTACFVHGLIAHPEQANRQWLRLDLWLTMLAGVGMVAVFPVVAAFFVPREWWLGLVGLILAAGAAFSLYLAKCHQMRRAVTVFAVMSVAWITAIFGFAALRIDRYQFAKPLAAQMDGASPGQRQIASFRFLRQSLVFYTGQPIRVFQRIEDLEAFLDASPNPLVITVDEHLQALQGRFPGRFREMARRPRFLHPGEVIVLAHRPGSIVPRTADRMTGPRR